MQDSGGMYRYIIRKGEEGSEFTPVIQLHQESRRLHIRVKTEGQEEERFDSIGFILSDVGPTLDWFLRGNKRVCISTEHVIKC